MQNRQGPGENESAAFDRRALLKKSAVGAAAAGVVWTAPRIEGLSLRPSYAAASSAGLSSASFSVVGNSSVFLVSRTAPLGGGDVAVAAAGQDINRITVDRVMYNGSGTPSFGTVNTTNPWWSFNTNPNQIRGNAIPGGEIDARYPVQISFEVVCV